MSDYRMANFIPLDNYGRLDILKAKFANMKFIIPASKTFQVTAPYEFNLPGISYAIYKDVGLWWALAIFNNIYDPLVDLVIGTVLLIPEHTALIALLENSDSDTRVEVLL